MFTAGCGDEYGPTGNFASSESFAVGATRLLESFAPHPPQKRESGTFSMPQVGQRIPSQRISPQFPAHASGGVREGACDTLDGG
jgi:hypothetical protein